MKSREIAKGTIGIDVPMTRLIDECLVTEMQPHMIDVMFGCATADSMDIGHTSRFFVFGSDSGWEAVDEDGRPLQQIRQTPSKLITNSMTLSASCRGNPELHTCT